MNAPPRDGSWSRPATQLERDRRFATEANVERYQRLLANSVDPGVRKQIEALLYEERAKLGRAMFSSSNPGPRR